MAAGALSCMTREYAAETVAALTVSNSRSIRTVPVHVAGHLGLEPGSSAKRDVGKVEGNWMATICKAGAL